MAATNYNPNRENADTTLTTPKGRMAKAPPKKARLDAALIEQWRDYPAKPFVIRDTVLRGFSARFGTSGAVSYSILYRDAEGKQRQFALDSPAVNRADIGKPLDEQRPSTDPADFRAAADLVKLRLRDDRAGNDPLWARQTATDAAAKRVASGRTVGDAAALWLARRRDKHSAPADRTICKHYVTGTPVGDFPIFRLQSEAGREAFRDAVREQFNAITAAGKPFMANRVVSFVGTLWNYMGGEGVAFKRAGKTVLIEGLRWLDAPSPIRALVKARNAEPPRKHTLAPDELATVMRYLRQRRDAAASKQILMLVLTGARRGEVVGARWEQFDLRRGLWTKPAELTKAGRETVTPLAAPLIAALDDMHAKAGRPARGSIWPDADAGRASRLRRFWERLRADCGLQEQPRIHDIRRNFGSLAYNHGVAIEAVSAALGHASIAVTQRHYAHPEAELARGAVDAVARLIDDASE